MFALPRIAARSSRQSLIRSTTKLPPSSPTIPPSWSSSLHTPRLVNFSTTRANLKPNNNHNNNIPPYIWALASLPILGGGFVYYKYLDEVPLTKRQRWLATSSQWEQQMGNAEYHNLLQQFQNQTLPKDHRASVTVQRVGLRIAQAAQEFAQEYGTDDSKIAFPKPTFTVVRSDQANAFVLPGNHIFVFTGLFDYIQTEDELAAVLGHEMAHTLARHVGEKISSNILVQLLGRLSLLVDPSGALLALIIPSASILREMPNSRTQEHEADRIGMHLASRACYNPQAAQHFFQKLQEEENAGNAKGSSSPPQFLSTHPSHDSRIDSMQGWLSETNPIFNRDEGNACRKMREDMARARRIAAQRHMAREQQQQPQRVVVVA